MEGIPPGRGDVRALLEMRAFIERLLSPEEFGHAVTAEVRDAAREALGLPKCETVCKSSPPQT